MLTRNSKSLLQRWLNAVGYRISKIEGLPPDFTQDERALVLNVREFTATSPERIIALKTAVEFIVRNKVPGSLVECGVWRGGSVMTIALTLLKLGETNRNLYLFDTFEGMTPPTAEDYDVHGQPASTIFSRLARKTGGSDWCCATVEEVRSNIASTGYPMKRVHLIKGRVEETIPNPVLTFPIALVRLDTDWYGSTKHELIHLFPLLGIGGVLMLDDYGTWAGARKAIDEYLKDVAITAYLHRIDSSGRLLLNMDSSKLGTEIQSNSWMASSERSADTK